MINVTANNINKSPLILYSCILNEWRDNNNILYDTINVRATTKFKQYIRVWISFIIRFDTV